VERIKELYLDHGYLQIQVGNPKLTLSNDKKWFEITYTIIEGVPFTVKKMEIQGNTIFPKDEIRSVLKTKENELFRRNIWRQDLAAITDLTETRAIFTRT
jgi:outer membrane protein insertion porin family